MSRMITCAEAVKQLWEYLDGVVEDAERAKLEEHLAFCRRCCGEVEFLEELQKVLASRAAEAIPPDAHARLLSTLETLEEGR